MNSIRMGSALGNHAGCCTLLLWRQSGPRLPIVNRVARGPTTFRLGLGAIVWLVPVVRAGAPRSDPARRPPNKPSRHPASTVGSASMLSAKTRALLDQSCDVLSVTIPEHNRILKEAAEQQLQNGIAGRENLDRFAAIKYFPLFEGKVKSAHAGALAVIDSCHTWEPLREIPTYIEAKTEIFADEVHQKVVTLGRGAPFKPELKDIPALHASLKKDFRFKCEVLIRNKRKDFLLKIILVPLALGLLWKVLK